MPINRHVRRLDAIQAKKAQRDPLDLLADPPTDKPCTEPEKHVSAAPVPGRSRRATVTGVRTAQVKRRHSTAPDHVLVPMSYDVSARNNWGAMDVALFRLCKRDLRANSIIQYNLSEGYVKVTSGINGMASIWDYDIVLMAISYLTEAMNNFLNGKGERPSRLFRPHVSDIFRFCDKSTGGNQRDKLIDALVRLNTTHVQIQRTRNVRTHTNGESLISYFNVISNSRTQNVEYIEIEIANWIYDEITNDRKPDVRTVHPNYFKITQGVGRFVYRLARKSAGKDMALWGFETLYERSGSAGTFKEFCRLLRKVIKARGLPEYDLAEEECKTRSVLRIVHRSQADKWKL